MKYVGQTGRALKKRFGEHYRRMNKPKKDNFLYSCEKKANDAETGAIVNLSKKILSGAFLHSDYCCSRGTYRL